MNQIDINDLDLEKFNHGVSEYEQSYKAADQYAYDVLTGKIITNKHIKSSCIRYIKDRGRDDLDFNIEIIDMLLMFTNRLKHVKGAIAGQPILLMNWMIFILANLFGFYFNQGDREGERRFTKALCLVARGNAKSMICSVVALWTMLTSPNGSPSCFSVARNRQQARIVFDDAKEILRRSDKSIRSRFKPYAHYISCPGNNGLFRPLSSDSQSADGLRVSLGICDELHTHPDSSLMNVLKSGMSSTRDPILFMISTAGFNLEGVCVQQRDLGRLINFGIEKDDSYFCVEFSIDESDLWHDEKCWIKANPALGHAVNLNYLRGEVVNARQSQANRADFQTKYCNLFVNTNENAYLDILEVQKCAGQPLSEEEKQRLECYIGLDLAQKTDLCAISFLFPLENGGLYVENKSFLPYGVLDKVTASQRERYLNFADSGNLILTEGEATDFDLVEHEIREACKKYNVISVGYDPYASTQLAIKLTDERIPMIEVRQGYANMSEPAKLLQALILEKRFKYDSKEKLFEWCAANAVYTQDQNENIKVTKAKEKPNNKIDPIISLITGLALATIKDKPVKAYNNHSFRVV